jgi:hypothetical protein
MISIFIITFVIGSWMGSVEVKRIREQRRVRARVRALPASVSSVAESTEVRITGIVRALDETLTSPLSGRTCVLFRVRVGAGPMSAFPSRRARMSAPIERFELRPFLLDRGADGVAVIDGDYAELDLPVSRSWELAPTLREQFRAAHGLRDDQLHRCEEIVLASGTPITVIGFAMLDASFAPPTGEVGFRDGAPPRLRLTGSRARPLTISRAS